MSDAVVDLCKVVSESALGKDISEQDCQLLGEIVQLRDLEDDQVLFEEGTVDHTAYLLVAGRVAVIKGSGEHATTLHVLQTGDLAGELSFIDGSAHSATLVALGRASVMSLERERFESLIDSHPRVVYHVMRTIVRKVHSTLRRLNMQYVEMANYITKSHGRY